MDQAPVVSFICSGRLALGSWDPSLSGGRVELARYRRALFDGDARTRDVALDGRLLQDLDLLHAGDVSLDAPHHDDQTPFDVAMHLALFGDGDCPVAGDATVHLTLDVQVSLIIDITLHNEVVGKKRRGLALRSLGWSKCHGCLLRT